MVGPLSSTNSNHDKTPTPRWVKWLGIVAVVLALSFVVMLLFGGSNHGPRRHMPSSGITEPRN